MVAKLLLCFLLVAVVASEVTPSPAPGSAPDNFDVVKDSLDDDNLDDGNGFEILRSGHRGLRGQFMDPQNAARATLGLPPFRWDRNLEAYARNWAAQRKQEGCSMVHSDGPYGENISWGSWTGWSASAAAQDWVDERPFYNYNSNTCAEGKMCGHYTQIVWRTSTRIGCARVTCDNGNVFMTCNYDPPGNYIGERPY